MPSSYLSLLGSPGKIIYGIQQSNEAEKALKELNKQKYPSYMTAEQINQKAEGLAQGYSAIERANFFGSLARLNTQRYRTAVARNPTLSGVINAGINYGSTAAIQGFEASGAALRRQNVARLENLFSRQDQLNTGVLLDKRLRTEQALGAQQQAGTKNAFSGVQDVKNTIMSIFPATAMAGQQGMKNSEGFATSTTNYGGPPQREGFGGFGGYGTTSQQPAWGGMGVQQSGWNYDNSGLANQFPSLYGQKNYDEFRNLYANN